MARIVVIGAGPMGLAAAHRAVTLGHDVDLIEANHKVGGMAAHFDFSGLSIERFYHFVCLSDTPTFELMAELGIGHVTIQLETGQECDGELCGDEVPPGLLAGRTGLLHGGGLLHRH